LIEKAPVKGYSTVPGAWHKVLLRIYVLLLLLLLSTHILRESRAVADLVVCIA
jgi:hypothetical protein